MFSSLQLSAGLRSFGVNNETWFHLFCAPPDKPRSLLAERDRAYVPPSAGGIKAG